MKIYYVSWNKYNAIHTDKEQNSNQYNATLKISKTKMTNFMQIEIEYKGVHTDKEQTYNQSND